MEKRYNLIKILNFEHIKEIFYYLTKITGLKITLLDENGNLLIKPKGKQKYCILNTREDWGRRCRESDKYGTEKAKQKKDIYIYTCYAGLTDVVIPLFYENKFIGAAITGQVRLKNTSPPDFKKLANKKVSIDDLKEAYNNVPVMSKKILKSSARLLFHLLNYIIEVEMKRILEIEKRVNHISSTDSIMKAKEFIELNFRKDIDLNQLAKMFHFTPFYFSRLFKKITGINFKEYLLKLRIEEAKRLLIYSEFSVTNISYQIGFNDSNYFSYIFKKLTGMSPTQFRKQYTNKKLRAKR